MPSGFKWVKGTVASETLYYDHPPLLKVTVACHTADGFSMSNTFQTQPGNDLKYFPDRQKFISNTDSFQLIAQDALGMPVQGTVVFDGSPFPLRNGSVTVTGVWSSGSEGMGDQTVDLVALDIVSPNNARFSQKIGLSLRNWQGKGQGAAFTQKFSVPWGNLPRNCRFRVDQGSDVHHVSYDFTDVGKNSCNATCSNDRARSIAHDLLGWPIKSVSVHNFVCADGYQCGETGKSCRS